jgi:hypothetical protein
VSAARANQARRVDRSQRYVNRQYTALHHSCTANLYPRFAGFVFTGRDNNYIDPGTAAIARQRVKDTMIPLLVEEPAKQMSMLGDW